MTGKTQPAASGRQDDPDALVAQAQQSLAAGRFDEARALTEAGLRTDPGHGDLVRVQFSALIQAQDTAAAHAFLDRLSPAQAAHVNPKMAARLLRQREGVQTAQDFLDRIAPHMSPPTALYHIARAELFQHQGDTGAALAALDLGAADHPAHPDLVMQRCLLLRASGDAVGALNVLDAAGTGGRLAQLVPLRGRLLVDLGRWDEALGWLEAALKDGTGPRMQILQIAASLNVRLRNWAAADAQLAEIETLAPDNAEAAQTYARGQIVRGDPAAATRRLARAAGRSGWTPPLVRAMARAEDQAGWWTRALDRLTGPEAAPVETVIQTPADRLWLAGLMVRLGRFDDAAGQVAARADWTGPEQAMAAVLLARIAFARGHAETALTRAEEAAQHDPGNAEALRELVHAQLRLGLLDAAWDSHQGWLKLVAARDPGDGRKPSRSTIDGQILNEARLLLSAEDRQHAGPGQDPAAALPHFRRQLEGHPGNTPAAFALLAAIGRMPPGEEASEDPSDRGPGIPRRVGLYWPDATLPAPLAALHRDAVAGNPDHLFQRFDRRTGLAWLTDHAAPEVTRAFRITPGATGQANILALAVLWHDGGIWLDPHLRCQQPLEGIVEHGTHRARLVCARDGLSSVGTGFFAVQPRDPVIQAALADALDSVHAGQNAAAHWLNSGPGALSRALALHGTDANGRLLPGVRVLPEYTLRQTLAPHMQVG